jgi:ketopantoate reductase
MKRIIVIIIISLIFTVPICSFAQTISLTLPETEVMLVKNKMEWAKLCREYFPHDNPAIITGMAIMKYYSFTKRKYIIAIPYWKGSFEYFYQIEAVLGHEAMHILDYHNGITFDPDHRMLMP